MKIEQSDIRITEIPGIEAIAVKRGADGGVSVALEISARKRVTFTATEFREFVNGAQAARDALEDLVDNASEERI